LNKEGLYFVSFATVNWIDVFVCPQYNNIILESLKYCRTAGFVTEAWHWQYSLLLIIQEEKG